MRAYLPVITALLLLSIGRAPAADPFAEPFVFAPAGSPLEARRALIRGAFRLAARAPDGQPVHGLSGVAWSAARGMLYAVSDQGYLLHLRPVWSESGLANVLFAARYPLRDIRGDPLRRSARDAEGLALQRVDDRETLLVSFEQQARIMRYTPTGELLNEIAIPPSLDSQLLRAPRNRGLEGLVATTQHGLITGLENPVAGVPEHLELIAIPGGRRWGFVPVAPGGHWSGWTAIGTGR